MEQTALKAVRLQRYGYVTNSMSRFASDLVRLDAILIKHLLVNICMLFEQPENSSGLEQHAVCTAIVK